MRSNLTIIWLLGLVGLFATKGFATNDENLTIKEAIYLSAEQQILSQQIAKVYLALNNNISEPKFYQERDFAIGQFQDNIDKLKLFTPTDKVRNAMKYLRETWEEYKKIAEWSITEEGCEKLVTQSDGMLYACKQLMHAYEDYAKQMGTFYKSSEMAKIVNLIKEVSQQRMLTQRIMLYYLSAKQHIEFSSATKKLEEASNEYDVVLHDLASADINSDEIRKEITEMQKYWGALAKFCKKFEEGNNYINSMLLLANSLTEKAEKVIHLYQDLGKKLSISKIINVVSFQNMLTQRISKAYVAIAFNQQIPKFKRELSMSIDLFEQEMASLTKSAPNEDIKRAVGVVETMWKNYRKMAMDWSEMDAITVGKVLERSHVIMASCDRVAKAVEDYAQAIPEYHAFFVQNGKKIEDKNNIAHLVYTAGDQRTYSQRVAVYFMMVALEQDVNLSAQRLKMCVDKYNEGFEKLSSSSLNTPEIEKALTKSQKDWTIIESFASDPKEESIAAVLTHSESLFETLDKLNVLYEARMDELLTHAP